MITNLCRQRSPGELATLLLAQESIATIGLTALGSPFASYARSLLNKVRASLPAALRDRLNALSNVYGSAAVPAKDFAPHAATLDQLTTAVLECRTLQLNYHSLNRDLLEERLIEPYAVYFVPDGATLKLIGFDDNHQAIIPLSVDRIRAVEVTSTTFTRPADFDLRDFLNDNCFNGIHGAPLDVCLRAYGVTARIFAERTFHPSQRIIEQTLAVADQLETTTIEMRVASGRGLVRFILSWAPDVEVVDPPALHAAVAEAHRRALARGAALTSEADGSSLP